MLAVKYKDGFAVADHLGCRSHVSFGKLNGLRNINVHKLDFQGYRYRYFKPGCLTFFADEGPLPDFIGSLIFKLHRLDGPALVVNNNKFWYRYGVLHRVDGPAIERACGSSSWWLHGKRHRDGGPATICQSGKLEYWKKGRLINSCE